MFIYRILETSYMKQYIPQISLHYLLVSINIPNIIDIIVHSYSHHITYDMFLDSINYGYYDIFKKYIELNDDVFGHYNTPLAFSTFKGRVEYTKTLLEQPNVDLSKSNSFIEPPNQLKLRLPKEEYEELYKDYFKAVILCLNHKTFKFNDNVYLYLVQLPSKYRNIMIETIISNRPKYVNYINDIDINKMQNMITTL